MKNIKTVQDFQKVLFRYMLFIIILLFFVLAIFNSSAQSVVVNGYFNAADPRDEWTELVVIDDNVDMRGWTLRDNNATQTSWQTPITFNNIAFWNNMRAGTIIIIWHRVVNSSAVVNPEDNSKDDGYIQLSAQNSSYFTGGAFGTSPTWTGNSLNIAGSGEIVQIRNSSGTHIHALGHLNPPGTDWTALPTPKLNHANNASSGDAIYVCPGGNILDYNGPGTGNAYTSKNNVTITFGLPNTCGTAPNDNTNYIRLIREPLMTSQIYMANLFPAAPNPNFYYTVIGPNVNVFMQWNAAADPVASDQTQGYIIVRAPTLASIANPVDGKTYNVGDVLGLGVVVANIDNPGTATVSYTDNGLSGSGTYCYKVFAYRYGTDDINGDNYNVARGRAYNTTDFVEFDCMANPLPLEWIYFNTVTQNDEVLLRWGTASENNVSHFEVQKKIGFDDFVTIATRNAKNTNSANEYYYLDKYPVFGETNYYRIKQVDWNGAYTFTNTLSIDFKQNNNTSFWHFELNGENYITFNSINEEMEFDIFDITGRLLESKQVLQARYTTQLNYSQGVYIVVLHSGYKSISKKIIIR